MMTTNRPLSKGEIITEIKRLAKSPEDLICRIMPIGDPGSHSPEDVADQALKACGLPDLALGNADHSSAKFLIGNLIFDREMPSFGETETDPSESLINHFVKEYLKCFTPRVHFFAHWHDCVVCVDKHSWGVVARREQNS